MHTRCCLALAISVACFQFAARADQSNLRTSDRELLDLLRHVRQNVLLSETQGRGEAELQEDSDHSGLGGIPESIGPATVNFLFSGDTYAFRMSDAKDGRLILSRLSRDDRLTFYHSDYGNSIAGASVIRLENNPRVFLDVRIYAWTVAELGRVPWPDFPESDEKAFAQFAKMSNPTVQRHGDRISLNCVWDYKAPPGRADLYYTELNTAFAASFDLKVGGMPTSYKVVSTTTLTKGGMLYAFLDGQIAWNDEGGKVVPTRREVHSRQTRNGKAEVKEDSVVTFKRVALEPVPPAEVDMKELKIPPGTRVSDRVLGIDYHYLVDTTTRSGGTMINQAPSVPFDVYYQPVARSGFLTGHGWAVDLGIVGASVAFLAGLVTLMVRRRGHQ